jgi:hypothetical protein
MPVGCLSYRALINPKIKLFKTKTNLLYIRNQSVPRSKYFHHSYKNQPVNDVQNKGRCLFWDPYKTLNEKKTPCWIFEC